MIIPKQTATIAAAQYGCLDANQTRKTTKASSAKLRAEFDAGSGEGVTTARAAIFPPCAAKAIAPPAVAALICSQRGKFAVAWYARNAATGTRTNVCKAFQTRSKAGILSAKNSTTKSTPQIP